MFNEYPYRNLTDLNLDYVLRQIRDIKRIIDDFVLFNSIKYADPIQWNITTQYAKNTVVIDPNTGTAYLSVKPVPSGVLLTNTDFWTVIFTLNIIGVNQNITLRDDGSNLLATFESVEGDWLIWNNILYRVTRDIALNTQYVVGYNLERFSVELFIKAYIQDLKTYIDDLAGDLTDLTTTDKSNLVNAINEVLSTLGSVAGNLADLTTTDKSNLVNAINEVLSTLGSVAGNLADLTTTDKSNLVNAINEVLSTLGSVAGNLADLTTTDKSNLVNAINEVLSTLGSVTGNLGDLTTTDKDSLVDAINEVNQTGGGAVALIGDLDDLKTTDKDSVVDAINEVVGDVAEQTEDIFNVKSLNLDFSQDITNDIETLLQSHKRLYFPAGDYYFSITIKDMNVEIFGDGFYMLTKFHPTTGACITLDARGGVNCGNFKLHDVSIIGSNRNYNGIRTIGEYDTDPIDNVMIRDVYINDCDEGIYWNSRGIWGIFDHVWCHYCKRGLYVQMPNDCAFNHNQFNNCFFGYNRRQGIYLLGTSPFKINTNEFLHCNLEANFVLGHDSSDFSNVLIYANATSFVDCYFEAEDGACDIYASHSDFTVRGGVSIVPKGTFTALTTADCYCFIIGLHGYQTGSYNITDSGTNAQHCVVIGKTNSGYLDNGAYVMY